MPMLSNMCLWVMGSTTASISSWISLSKPEKQDYFHGSGVRGVEDRKRVGYERHREKKDTKQNRASHDADWVGLVAAPPPLPVDQITNTVPIACRECDAATLSKH